MCGRYALALTPAQVRRMLQDEDMPVWEAPADEGDDAPRQSYNFAPGYHGIVYRADTSDWGAGPRREHASPKKGKGKQGSSAHTATASHPGKELDEGAAATANPAAIQEETSRVAAAADGEEVHYKMQSMKWGLIPFWTKRNPDYGSMLKTINCRDDSLAAPGGMWSSMKARKRCVVIAQGFYEWLRVGPKEKVPHFVRRRDGKLMCFAGLWDCVRYEDDDQKHYTYTIITTSSNKQLGFLHDRMPVILDPGSDALRTWLDPARHEWSAELQALLKPYAGELDVYPVSKEVGKVGNNSPSFIIPVASRENKGNIANFFANSAAAAGGSGKGKLTTSKTKIGAKGGEMMAADDMPAATKVKPEVETKTAKEEKEGEEKDDTKRLPFDDVTKVTDDGGMDASSPPKARPTAKREAGSPPAEADQPPKKMITRAAAAAASPSSSPASSKVTGISPVKSKPVPAGGGKGGGRAKISSTSNSSSKGSPKKGKQDGLQKITKFFSK